MKKILMVEDIPIIQKLYKDKLSEAFVVDVVPNGKAALDALAEEEYDFILLDMLLPEINGEEFLAEYQKLDSNAKVIVLSDFDYPQTVERAKSLGVTDYLLKVENEPSKLLEKLKSYD